MSNVNLLVTQQEAELILNTLAELPFRQIGETLPRLIQAFHQQTAPQPEAPAQDPELPFDADA